MLVVFVLNMVGSKLCATLILHLCKSLILAVADYENEALLLTSLPGFPEGPGGPRGPIGPCYKNKCSLMIIKSHFINFYKVH